VTEKALDFQSDYPLVHLISIIVLMVWFQLFVLTLHDDEMYSRELRRKSTR
jgi:hypothetical protein